MDEQEAYDWKADASKFDPLAGVRAQAWDEAIEALAWCLANGPPESAVQYLVENNPYRKERS